MKKIKLNANIGGHKAGDTITVTNGTADALTRSGHVDAPTPKAKPEPKSDD